jgi:CelD/BcsL family acetyltransferase involved in cellulose biosynthesis
VSFEPLVVVGGPTRTVRTLTHMASREASIVCGDSSVPFMAGRSLLSQLRLQMFRSFSEAEATWRAAEEKCNCHVFQTFDWLTTWFETIGTVEDVMPCIVHAFDNGGNTVMLWPLGIRRRRGIRFLNFLGGIVADYHGPLVSDDHVAEIDAPFVAAFIRRLLAVIPPVDVIAFERIPDSLGAARNPLVGIPGAQKVADAHFSQLPSSFEEYKRSRSTKLFSDSARQFRRLSRLGQTHFVLSPTLDERDRILDALTRQKTRRWRETGAQDLFALPGYLAFYRSISARFLDCGRAHLAALMVGDTIVASHLGAVYRGRFYYILPGYEAGEWMRFSVGRLLMQNLIEWSITNGLKEFDLTVGDEAYKLQWADRSIQLYNYQKPVTMTGHLYCLATRTGKGMTTLAKSSNLLRSVVRRLRRLRP